MNRLTEIHYAEGGSTSFTYDALGRRVSEIERDDQDATIETRHLVWDGMTIAERRDADNNIQRRYFDHGYQAVFHAPPATENYYQTRDHLGSIREITNASGAAGGSVFGSAFGGVGAEPGAVIGAVIAILLTAPSTAHAPAPPTAGPNWDKSLDEDYEHPSILKNRDAKRAEQDALDQATHDCVGSDPVKQALFKAYVHKRKKKDACQKGADNYTCKELEDLCKDFKSENNQ